MSATTGFDVSALAALVNETEFGFMFYKEALMNNDTFAFTQKYGEVLQNAKNDTYKLGNFNGSATAQDGDGCGQNSVDQITHTQTTLTMVNIKFEGQFCPQTLEPYYLAAALPPGQHYESLGALGAQYIAEIQRQIAKKMAIMPYYGPTGADTVTYANNWISLLEADFDINEGATTPTSGGSAGTDTEGVFNIVETLVLLYLANPDTAAEVNSGNIVITMSPKHAFFYWQNYRKLYGNNTVVPAMTQLGNGTFQEWTHPGTAGVTIVVQNALGTEGQIISSRKRNQVLAFDLQSDATKLDVWYEKKEDLIYWRQRVKMGTAWRQLTPANINYWGTAS